MSNITQDTKKWYNIDGINFLNKIGIKKGDFVIDFGCNDGDYTIPLSKVVTNKGLIFAVDQEKSTLANIQKFAKKLKIKNIETVNTEGGITFPLQKKYKNKIDAVFLYDILHYLKKEKRTKLYIEIIKWLKPNGLLSVYPKHNAEDWPMWNLADLTIKNIISEIEDTGYHCQFQQEFNLFHDGGYDQGMVLNFIYENKNIIRN